PSVFAALALCASVATAQDQRPMSIDDFLSLRIIGDPQISPSGNEVAFTVSVPSLTENRNVSRLWVLNLADGSTRELTQGTGSDLMPRWAKDGRTLVFLSTRSGSPQVWRIRTDGGEPSRLTSAPE